MIIFLLEDRRGRVCPGVWHLSGASWTLLGSDLTWKLLETPATRDEQQLVLL